MTKFELRKYKEYLLSRGYSVYDRESASTSTYVGYIRKTGDEHDYFITFWNDRIFLQYGSSPMVGASDSIACTNKALQYGFKGIPPGLLIVSACREGRKMMEELNNYCIEKILIARGALTVECDFEHNYTTKTTAEIFKDWDMCYAPNVAPPKPTCIEIDGVWYDLVEHKGVTVSG